MSKIKVVLLATVLLASAGGTAAYVLQQREPEGIEVQTAQVERREIIQTVTATGKIQPEIRVKISADVSAKITRLAVKEGGWVEQGDFLLELDRERYVAAVERAEASLRSSQANVTLCDENRSKAEKDYQRTAKLNQEKLEPQSSLDAVYAAYQVAVATHQSALDQVEEVRATLKQARDDLAKTQIYSPMAGTVSELNKEVGEIALGSQFQEDVILVVSNLEGMEALVDVDENDIVSIELGQSAEIEIDALPDQTFHGKVTEIANSAKTSSEGTSEQKTEFEVKIAITDASDQLRPGMTATSDVITEVRDSVLAVPIQSVAVRTPEELEPEEPEKSWWMFWAANGDASGSDSSGATGTAAATNYVIDDDGFAEIVFVIEGGATRAQQVQTGIQSESHIEIVGGLEEGGEIVIGNYRAISKDLKNGSAVTVGDGDEEGS